MDDMTLWAISILVAVAVTGVVAVLLALVIGTARDIRDAVAMVWTRGQQVANNTIHIALLDKTVDATRALHVSAGRILGHAEALHDHAETCPGCPQCIFAGGKGGAR
jgi:nitrate reductase gamma subunit